MLPRLAGVPVLPPCALLPWVAFKKSTRLPPPCYHGASAPKKLKVEKLNTIGRRNQTVGRSVKQQDRVTQRQTKPHMIYNKTAYNYLIH